jgi:hypothetical protein
MNVTNTTEPYMYAIIILIPIIGFVAVSICIKYICYFCNGGSRIEYEIDDS